MENAKRLAAQAFLECSVAKTSFFSIRSAESVSWHPDNSYSLAMQAKEAFHTETPNPSFKRTGTGRPALGLISFWPKPVPPAPAA